MEEKATEIINMDKVPSTTRLDGHGDPEVPGSIGSKPLENEGGFRETKQTIETTRKDNTEEVRANNIMGEVRAKIEGYINSDDYIPKKIAALEVAKHLRNVKMMGVGGIVSMFITLLLTVYNRNWAYGFIVVAVISMAYMVYKNEMEMKRLKSIYGV